MTEYTDGLSVQLINDMRVRAHQRAVHAAKEKAKKAKFNSTGIDDEDGHNNKNAVDITKSKDLMTTDYNGKVLAVKHVKVDVALPKLTPSYTKPTILQSIEIADKEEQRQLNMLKTQTNMQVDKMRREFIEDGMGFKTLSKDKSSSGISDIDHKKSSMNLIEKVQPGIGVVLSNGGEVINGPDYLS